MDLTHSQKLKQCKQTTTTLIILNEKTEDIMKIVKSLEDSGLLIKAVTRTVEKEAIDQSGAFLVMLLGTLGVSV